MVEGCSYILCSGKKDTSGTCDRHWYFMGGLVYGVVNVSGVCGLCPQVITVVVINSGSNIILLGGVDSERFSALSTFVEKDFDYWWIKWGIFKVE